MAAPNGEQPIVNGNGSKPNGNGTASNGRPPQQGIHQRWEQVLFGQTTALVDVFAAALKYAGTKHGWCPPDSQVYDHDQAEKAWGRLTALLSGSLA